MPRLRITAFFWLLRAHPMPKFSKTMLFAEDSPAILKLPCKQISRQGDSGLLRFMYNKDSLRKKFGTLIGPLINFLDRLGLKPIHITVAGLVLTVGACFAYYAGYAVTAFLLMLIGRFCDAIDGAFARNTNQVTQFGGFLDSLIDRYGEFIIAGTILFVYREQMHLYYFSFVLFLGISLMSYSRALYEKYGVHCPGNPFEYFERGILMLIFFLLGRLDIWLIVVGIGANVFVFHRLYRFYKATLD